MARNKLVMELAVAGVMLLAGWVVMFAVFGTPYPFYVVASGSMIPALEVNDILLVQGHDPIEAVSVGDIIVFDRPDGAEKVIVHRVVEVVSEEPRILRTRGDANSVSIPGTDFPITSDEYIGTVMYVVPKVGYVTKALAPPVNYVLIAIIIGFMVYKHWRSSRRPHGPPPDADVGDLDAVPRDGEYSALDGPARPGHDPPDGDQYRLREGHTPRLEPGPAPKGAPGSADHYGALGLDRFATTPEIRRRYVELAGEHEAGRMDDARFESIARAYETLSDPELRRRHDESLGGGPA